MCPKHVIFSTDYEILNSTSKFCWFEADINSGNDENSKVYIKGIRHLDLTRGPMVWTVHCYIVIVNLLWRGLGHKMRIMQVGAVGVYMRARNYLFCHRDIITSFSAGFHKSSIIFNRIHLRRLNLLTFIKWLLFIIWNYEEKKHAENPKIFELLYFVWTVLILSKWKIYVSGRQYFSQIKGKNPLMKKYTIVCNMVIFYTFSSYSEEFWVRKTADWYKIPAAVAKMVFS